ncbi:MAG TPA: lipid-A-disaccharide synthase [Terriglobia bacterium]|nr:lipid-A-disaccharide synthase [Terriglobia bacterium]
MRSFTEVNTNCRLEPVHAGGNRAVRVQYLRVVGSSSARILIVAGERSGDLYGAELAHALRARLGEVEIFGCGGDAMRRAGVQTIADLREFAMVGITEVVSGLPRARRAFHMILAETRRRRPELAVLIDAPSLNLRLAKKLKPRGIRVAYYVSPQIWAWKKWRLRHLRSRVDKMLCLFDFEQEIYRRAGVPVEYVGHPLIDRPEIAGPGLAREEFFATAGLDPAVPMVALLPGSRKIELKYILPGLIEGARELRRRRSGRPIQFLLPVAATLDRIEVESSMRAQGAVPEFIRTVSGATHEALRHADAAVVASGTATLETALLGCPMVVVYRVAPSTAFFARFMLDVPFYSMVNLLAGKPVVPELIQDDFTAERVASETERLLDDSKARQGVLEGYRAVRQRLGPGGAAQRAAHAVVEMLRCHVNCESHSWTDR